MVAPAVAAAPAAGAGAAKLIGAIGAGLGGIGGIISGLGGSSPNYSANAVAMEHQSNVAWDSRVRDAVHLPEKIVYGAQAAGIHPLVAMGVQPSNFTPQHIGLRSEPDSKSKTGAALQNMGQSISRAADRYDPKHIKNQHLDQLLRQTQIESMALDNQLKIQEIQRNAQSAQDPPSIQAEGTSIIPGQGGSQNVQVVPEQVIPQGSPGHTPAVHAKSSFSIDEDGYVWSHLSKNIAESIESDMPNAITHTIVQGGKYIRGWFAKPKTRPKLNLPNGKILVYNKIRGQWRVRDLSAMIPKKLRKAHNAPSSLQHKLEQIRRR